MLLVTLCRRGLIPSRATRLTLAYALALNELIWWIFRYSHEGFHFPKNLPLQLCDIAVWTTVIACISLRPIFVEFSYFAGFAGSAMAVLMPDLWSPWPSYPAIYFFLAHGGVILAISFLVFGGASRLRPGAVWRAFLLLIAYAALVGVFDAVFRTNYMYLCSKPKAASLLDTLGPWPVYLVSSLALALALFGILWLPARRRR